LHPAAAPGWAWCAGFSRRWPSRRETGSGSQDGVDPLATTMTSYSSLEISRWYAAEREYSVRGASRGML